MDLQLYIFLTYYYNFFPFIFDRLADSSRKQFVYISHFVYPLSPIIPQKKAGKPMTRARPCDRALVEGTDGTN
jgi:hypothetical protein